MTRGYLLLSDLIHHSNLNEDDKHFFMSKKTLINEFNHFEFNMSVFHPAIDIKDNELKVEIEDVLKKINELTI